MSHSRGSLSSRHTKSNQSNKSAGSRTSISVKLPEPDVDQQLTNESPVQVRGLSPSRTPRHEYIIESRKNSALRNFTPHSSGTMAPQGTPTHTLLSDKEVKRIIATRIIERCWTSYRDRQMFKLLKHAVCAAEHSLSHEILRKVSPKEAELLRDKCMQSKIRFRFGGQEFPPMIYFKVYACNTDGLGVKYVSGKKMIQPATEAARDACELMGHRQFYDQLIQDMMRRGEHSITDEVDVTTLKDYMKYLSLLDETPSYLGGRDNCWRKLTLEVLPRWTVFYDLVGFLYTHKMSPHLAEQIPSLLLPVNEENKLNHIQILSEIRPPEPPVNKFPVKSVPMTETARRSRQARSRAGKMKRAYQTRNAEQDGGVEGSGLDRTSYPTDPHHFPDTYRTDTTGNHDNHLEGSSNQRHGIPGNAHPHTDVLGHWDEDEEVDKLYEWTQQLSFEDLATTPRLQTNISGLHSRTSCTNI